MWKPLNTTTQPSATCAARMQRRSSRCVRYRMSFMILHPSVIGLLGLALTRVLGHLMRS